MCIHCCFTTYLEPTEWSFHDIPCVIMHDVHHSVFMHKQCYNHRCPFPMGWLINRGASLAHEQKGMMINSIPVAGPSIRTNRTLLVTIINQQGCFAAADFIVVISCWNLFQRENMWHCSMFQQPNLLGTTNSNFPAPVMPMWMVEKMIGYQVISGFKGILFSEQPI